MKTTLHCALFACAPLSLLAAADVGKFTPAIPSSAQPKTHVLFMGTDISVQRGETFHRVRDVSGSKFVINVNGRPEFVSSSGVSLGLKVEQGLKLTAVRAQIDNLKGERAYTPRNDPQMHAVQTQARMAMITSEQRDAAIQNLRGMVSAENTRNAAIARGGPEGAAAAQTAPPDVAGAVRGLEMAERMSAGDFGSGAFYSDRARAEEGAENFDAIEVTFEVSSPDRLTNPYVIIVSRFRERKAPENEVRNWIFAQSLDPIEAKPTKVRVKQGGFPFGFILEDFEVHLYERGREVATNVSRKRVELTRDDALQYLVIDHVAANKNATVPAAPVLGSLPSDFSSRLAAGEGQQVYYVKVSKEGRVLEAYSDEAYTKTVDDPYFAEAIRGIYFKPALEKGKPVESKVAVNLTRLSF